MSLSILLDHLLILEDLADASLDLLEFTYVIGAS